MGGPQFLAQVRLIESGEKDIPPGLLLLFHCQNKIGQCDSWSSKSGVFPEPLGPITPIVAGASTRKSAESENVVRRGQPGA